MTQTAKIERRCASLLVHEIAAAAAHRLVVSYAMNENCLVVTLPASTSVLTLTKLQQHIARSYKDVQSVAFRPAHPSGAGCSQLYVHLALRGDAA